MLCTPRHTIWFLLICLSLSSPLSRSSHDSSPGLHIDTGRNMRLTQTLPQCTPCTWKSSGHCAACSTISCTRSSVLLCMCGGTSSAPCKYCLGGVGTDGREWMEIFASHLTTPTSSYAFIWACTYAHVRVCAYMYVP
jgi:hypothetical protein